MYFQPYGNGQQLNLNWIINEIIELHKQLDPDYETPSFSQIYPYSNLNQLNLDWILSELKALKELAPEPTPALDIQAVAEALVALPFDSTKSYQIFDYISKDGEIWRATEAITAGGAWDETKWYKTKLGTDLAVLDRWINSIDASLNTLEDTVENLSSMDISDDSSAGGATVKASLNNLKGSLTSLTNAHQLTDLDKEHIIKYSDGRIQLKYFDGTAQYILTFNPVNKSITQAYSADGVNFTEQWTTKVTEPTATMASQSKYTFDVGGEMTIEKSGHVVQIVGGFLCVTPELSSPGQLIASGLPAPSATIFCTLDSRNEAETSARVVLDTSGNLYFRYGHANSEYDLCIVYIGQ